MFLVATQIDIGCFADLSPIAGRITDCEDSIEFAPKVSFNCDQFGSFTVFLDFFGKLTIAKIVLW